MQNKTEKHLPKFAEETTLHGLKHIVGGGPTSNKIKQAAWGVMFFIFLSVCFVLLIVTTYRYFQYESTTTVLHEKNSSLDFPSVTICNIQMFKHTDQFSIVDEYGANRYNPESKYFSNSTYREHLKTELKKINSAEYARSKSFSLKETFISCKFGNEIIPCSSYVTETFTDISLCYTFNSQTYVRNNGSLLTSSTGEEFGVQLLLNANSERGIYIGDKITVGFRLAIHHPSIFPLMTKKSFLVAPGFENYVPIRKYIVNKLSVPYSNTACEGQIEDGYSQEYCIYECKDENSNGTCSNINNKKQPCTMYDTLEYVYYLFLNPITQATEKDQCGHCLPTCNMVGYDYTISQAAFSDGNTQLSAQNNNWPSTNLSYIKQNYVQIRIYYDTLDYTMTMQRASLTFVSVLSDIGGLLGIFLGASLMTVIEIIEYLFHVLWLQMQKKNKL